MNRCIHIALALAAATARASILIGDDESDNLLRAPDGAPWAYVGALQTDFGGGFETKASGVYLGGNFMLTAFHVAVPQRVVLGGVAYAADATFTSVQVGTGDLRIFKILGNPGLPTLPLQRTADGSDTSRASTHIGFGVGRAFAVPGQGWAWGSVSTQFLRWGTNTTLAGTFNADTVIATSFDFTAGSEEVQPTFADSGSGLFQKNAAGTWKLAGLTVGVDTQNYAYYDNDAATAGNQPDRGFYERIRNYRTTLLTLTGLLDVSTWLESWRHFYFGVTTNTGNAANTADPDGDGVKNAAEFAFGLDPTAADADRLPQPSRVAGLLTLAFDEPHATGGVTYAAESSADLTAWSPVADTGSGIHHVFTAPAGSAAFMRLKATVP